MGFKWLDFKITKNCNNHCEYCGVTHDPPGYPELLSIETISRTLEDAINLGFSHIALLGGEPSIREDIESLFPRIPHAPNLQLLIITNGLVYKEGMYRSAFQSEVGTVKIVYSFDSFVSPNYKRQNPEAALQHIDAMRRLAEEFQSNGYQRGIEIHSVISQENFRYIIPLVDYFSQREINISLALVCPSTFTHTKKESSYNHFSYNDLELIIAQLEALQKHGALNFANRTLLQYLRLYPYDKLSMASKCRAGRSHVVINFDGEVYPCVTEGYRRGIRFGNIISESFFNIYSRMNTFECTSDFAPACWDHYLWNALEVEMEGDGA